MVYKLLNLSHLDEYFQGEEASVRVFLKLFCTSVADDLKLLELAIALENKENIEKVAHKLKSSYRYIGIFTMGDLLEDIETLAYKNTNFIELKLLFDTGLRMQTEVINDITRFLTN